MQIEVVLRINWQQKKIKYNLRRQNKKPRQKGRERENFQRFPLKLTKTIFQALTCKQSAKDGY